MENFHIFIDTSFFYNTSYCKVTSITRGDKLSNFFNFTHTWHNLKLFCLKCLQKCTFKVLHASVLFPCIFEIFSNNISWQKKRILSVGNLPINYQIRYENIYSEAPLKSVLQNFDFLRIFLRKKEKTKIVIASWIDETMLSLKLWWGN